MSEPSAPITLQPSPQPASPPPPPTSAIETAGVLAVCGILAALGITSGDSFGKGVAVWLVAAITAGVFINENSSRRWYHFCLLAFAYTAVVVIAFWFRFLVQGQASISGQKVTELAIALRWSGYLAAVTFPAAWLFSYSRRYFARLLMDLTPERADVAVKRIKAITAILTALVALLNIV